MDKTMDKTEAMILETEKNHVLHNKADKDYNDIILRDENVVLVQGGGTRQFHFSVKFRARTHACFSSSVVLRTNTAL